MFNLLQKTGLMSSDGRCHPDDDFYDAIMCPSHTAKVAKADMEVHCQQSNEAPCPQVGNPGIAIRSSLQYSMIHVMSNQNTHIQCYIQCLDSMNCRHR